jgi:hypothetical protein
LFLILSPDFAAAAVVVVIRGGGAGGDAVKDDNTFFFSSSSCFPSSGEELFDRECDEGCEILLS